MGSAFVKNERESEHASSVANRRGTPSVPPPRPDQRSIRGLAWAPGGMRGGDNPEGPKLCGPVRGVDVHRFRASEVQSLDHPGHASALGRSRLVQRLNARPHVVRQINECASAPDGCCRSRARTPSAQAPPGRHAAQTDHARRSPPADGHATRGSGKGIAERNILLSAEQNRYVTPARAIWSATETPANMSSLCSFGPHPLVGEMAAPRERSAGGRITAAASIERRNAGVISAPILLTTTVL
jgi:hypothetical protein